MKIIPAIDDHGVMSPETPIPVTYFSVCYNGGMEGYEHGAFIVYESAEEVLSTQRTLGTEAVVSKAYSVDIIY